MESVGADDQDANQLLSELLCKCRVCGKPDSYTNLFYNINKELLKNLISLLQAEITDSDDLSKWLCRECAELVEAFVGFRNKFTTNFNRTQAILEAFKSRVTLEHKSNEEIDALEEQFEAELEDEEAGVDYSAQDFTKDVIEEICDRTTIEPPEEISLKTLFECEVCNKSYRYLNSLNRHVKTAHELERFSCTICSARFTQKPSLTEHMKNLHSDEQTSLNLRCDFESCEKSFNTSKMLHQHTKKAHSGATQDMKPAATVDKLKKYRKQCTICGLFFKHIDEHKLAHQAISTYQCDSCDKTFKFKTSLNVHRRIHLNERNFECNICNKRFRVSHHLKEHLTIHCKDKTFVCEVLSCSKKFSSKLNLYKHSKLHMKKA